ncbi:fungal-specific transcription factor domain-containing protein [Aspergillus pseudonomiae]|uniref:Fungal-specific transcription factor domain-containing protein n=1 Tax=Aspergillus pseudonomiae TaxID=1506151 RepID=A0A5N6HJ25_9EURO|nr:fungal-specific transcription factor domain-containing protein [Aspergillus pseudonomiae]KAB8254315.1 fungal-specific transcription factor domain-containing protein [Aspergillus pseudonomiae]KAE8397653.1 fungal-specific transcription factor domain-containing protein [Aspergillus pseudonomiae]
MREFQISWQPGFSLSKKPVRRSRTRRPNADPHQLEFIVEHPAQDQHSLRSRDLRTSYGVTTKRRPYRHSSIDICIPAHLSTSLGRGEAQRSDTNVFGLNGPPEEPSVPISIPPGILYSTLGQRYNNVLQRYNMEFCRIPLTSDMQMNPFMYRESSGPKPMFLIHAVMALAGHHVESESTDIHRHAALQSLRENLNTCTNPGHSSAILDTIAILFSLDETQSALGTWRTHLLGAHGLVEACGGINMWVASASTQVQIGILLWWDAITSLVNREDCVFPYEYFEALLFKYNSEEWDFFSLCGCPLSLVKVVMQVARLAAEQRRSPVTQAATVLSAIERSLETWHHISPATAFKDEESMQQDVDNMHCAEAWRNGLLLYLYRVFRWAPGQSVPMHTLYRARVIMDHVFACRNECMVSRQALLPLFFAGCELRDHSSRRKILDICASWNDRTRYHMFSTAIPLLEAVWTEQTIHGFDNVWWGQTIDKQHTSDSHSPLQVRISFG